MWWLKPIKGDMSGEAFSLDRDTTVLGRDLYFPRLTVQSCGQGEQPLGHGPNFLLGDPWA